MTRPEAQQRRQLGANAAGAKQLTELPRRIHRIDERIIAHRFHRTGDDDLGAPGPDLLGRTGNRLQPRAAVTLNGHGGNRPRQIGAQGYHPSHVCSINRVARTPHDDLIDGRRIDVRPGHQFADHLAAKLHRGDFAEGRAGLRKRRSDAVRDDDFCRHGGLVVRTRRHYRTGSAEVVTCSTRQRYAPMPSSQNV